ncbi:unnamed protein product [Rotaria sordida]|uniref:Uncharacterized protein n=1 Tax=Rotaria sordida TaxID=392033 RepID=A0A814YCK3_9BILA|nr:unnamed protein product [Rotaria sordida]CAF1227120.1 unnamed protein product [Rotaria sordida]CAF1227481.1 unnamed protein product [Rotaria sordida]
MRRHRQIALLGFPGVEKSSLVHHFVYKHFYNEYDPNIKTKLTIIDNARSDLYTINHIDFENSDVYILVYAIDDLQRVGSSEEGRNLANAWKVQFVKASAMDIRSGQDIFEKRNSRRSSKSSSSSYNNNSNNKQPIHRNSSKIPNLSNKTCSIS